ncbi:hypothetical protein KR074_010622 [Drosophila pseudoananassae]|nr:hypothetical protein KR074_010622 [Drosophila pseudoananassae]
MFGTAFNLLVLAALVAASLLVLPSEGTPVMNDTVDRPNTDYKALFVAYLDMGTALFGTWAPEGVMEEWIRKRQAFYDA